MDKNYQQSMKKLKKFKYNWWRILLTIVFFPLILPVSLLVSLIFTRYLFKYPRTEFLKKAQCYCNTYEELQFDIQKKQLKNIKIDSKKLKEFEIQTESGDISCLLLKNDSTKWVVSLHGFKRNKYIAQRNSFHLYKKGYNIISFDAYAHGKTYGKNSDLGITNSKILNEIILWIKSKHDVSEIGIIGVSMGAASAIYWAQQFYKSNPVNWLISDCSLTQPVEQIRFFLKMCFKIIPWWSISFMINKFFKVYSKTNLNDMNLQSNLDNLVDLPILFIHGKKDSFISYHNSIVMFEHLRSLGSNKAEIIIFEKSGHSASIVDYQEEYCKKTLEFINKNK